jgi:hypothetical protein
MTFTRAFHTIALLAAMLGTFGCAKKSGDEPRKILADISVLQTKEEALIAEMATRENIFIADRLEGFPENRDELKPVAQQQIESLNGIIELEDRQVAKLESISSVTADQDFFAVRRTQPANLEKAARRQAIRDTEVQADL